MLRSSVVNHVESLGLGLAILFLNSLRAGRAIKVINFLRLSRASLFSSQIISGGTGEFRSQFFSGQVGPCWFKVNTGLVVLTNVFKTAWFHILLISA